MTTLLLKAATAIETRRGRGWASGAKVLDSILGTSGAANRQRPTEGMDECNVKIKRQDVNERSGSEARINKK